MVLQHHKTSLVRVIVETDSTNLSPPQNTKGSNFFLKSDHTMGNKVSLEDEMVNLKIVSKQMVRLVLHSAGRLGEDMTNCFRK